MQLSLGLHGHILKVTTLTSEAHHLASEQKDRQGAVWHWGSSGSGWVTLVSCQVLTWGGEKGTKAQVQGLLSN